MNTKVSEAKLRKASAEADLARAQADQMSGAATNLSQTPADAINAATGAGNPAAPAGDDQSASVSGNASDMRAKLDEVNLTENARDRRWGMQIQVKRVDENAKLPAYQSAGAAAFDLHALHDGHIAPGAAMTFRTGLMIEVPDGACLKIYSRSGQGFKHGVRLANSVGVIDCDYRGEILVRLTNDNAREVFAVSAGDSIAQAMVEAAPQFEIVEADVLTTTERGANGFGSTDAQAGE